MLVYAQLRKALTRVALGIVVIAGIAALSVPNAKAADATATVNADIVAAIAIANNTALDFGGVVSGTAGTVAIAASAAGTRTCTTVTCADSATVSAAKFSVTGESGLTYAITGLPSSLVIKKGGGGTAATDITVDTFVLSQTTGTVADSFYVGATLNVSADDEAGLFTGTFTMTVDYN